MRRCLIYLDEKALPDSAELLEAARQIHAGDLLETTGVTLGHSAAVIPDGFNRIIRIVHPALQAFDALAVAGVLKELHERDRFDSILVPATPFGRMIAPRLAMRLKTGLVADVTAISRQGSELNAIRPAYSGRLLASIAFAGEGPVMMSIRPGAFRAAPYEGPAALTEDYKPVSVRDGRIRCLGAVKREQAHDIRESDVLVSGGGGVIGKFHHLERLARQLGGQVSASRKIVDHGSAPRSIQVGQSGKRVSPRLYIALGINGAVQHVEGLKQVESIISVNLNRNAPICSLSDLVVEGDAVTFIDKLVARIEGGKAAAPGEGLQDFQAADSGLQAQSPPQA